MNNKRELVSIITPTYNSEKFIAETIESVLAQTYSNWELLITDDFSEDNTKSIVEKYVLKDSRIKLQSLQSNAGSAVARNNSLNEAKGRYIAFLDSDDLWSPQKLEKQISFMQNYKVLFSYTSYYIVTEKKEITGKITPKKKLNYYSYLRNTAITCSTVMIDIEQTGMFEMPNIRSSQDMATWLLLLKKGHTAVCLNQPLTYYRIVSNSLSAKKIKSSKSVWNVYRKIEQLSLAYSAYCFACYSVNAAVKRINGYYLQKFMKNTNKLLHDFFKRSMDIVLSIIGIILLVPLFAIVALIIKSDSKGPVFFKQKRLGKNGSVFEIIKFRSMVVNAEFTGTGIFNMSNDPRITKVGNILRKYSIDELPQLFNIIKGDMSFVGPRPPVTYELGDFEKLNNFMKRRFIVKPGVTGYAQTNGRNELNWDEKIVHDNRYIDDFYKFGILVDVKVLFITIIKVLKNEGAFELEENVTEDMKRIKNRPDKN